MAGCFVGIVIEVSDENDTSRHSLWPSGIAQEPGLRGSGGADAGIGHRGQLRHLQPGGCGDPSPAALSESGTARGARPVAEPERRGLHSDGRLSAEHWGHREDRYIPASRVLSLVRLQHHGRRPARECAWHPGFSRIAADVWYSAAARTLSCARGDAGRPRSGGDHWLWPLADALRFRPRYSGQDHRPGPDALHHCGRNAGFVPVHMGPGNGCLCAAGAHGGRAERERARHFARSANAGEAEGGPEHFSSASRDEYVGRQLGPGVSGRQQRLGYQGGGAARRLSSPHGSASSDHVGRGSVCAAHRLRQRGQSAAGARHGAEARGRDPRRDRRHTGAAGGAATHGKPVACRARWSAGAPAGLRGRSPADVRDEPL